MVDHSPSNASPRVVVTGLGLITPLGDDINTFGDALHAGRTAFLAVEDERLDKAGVDMRLAAAIDDFDPARYLGDGNVRPLDRTARLSASAAARALASAGWRGEDATRGEGEEIGLVLGTMFGSVHTISAFDIRAQSAGPNYAKPLDFANSVINAAAGQTAIWHDLRGVNSTVAGGPTAGVEALASATALITSGRVSRVLAGGAEELAIEAWVGFARAGLMATMKGHDAREHGSMESDCPVPFATNRSGFALGEAAGFVALEREDDARNRGANILASIAGHGTAFDPSRGEDVTSQAAALRRAITIALQSAGAQGNDIPGETIDLVSCSASGDPKRDLAEATAIAETVGHEVPVVAIKANVGECLGAAGALQVAAALTSIARGEVPGIAGLKSPDDAVPLRGLTAALKPAPAPMQNVLITALGLDGKAEALLLRGGDT